MGDHNDPMINHRGTRMKMSDFMKLDSMDHVRKNACGELETQSLHEYFEDMARSTMALLDPAGFCRRLATDSKFRETNEKWFVKEKAEREKKEKMMKEAANKKKEEAEEEKKSLDPEAQRLADKKKKRNQLTRERKKNKKRLLKEGQQESQLEAANEGPSTSDDV